jgi:hypothetical protein
MSLLITPRRLAFLRAIERGQFREVFGPDHKYGRAARLKTLKTFGYIAPEFVTDGRDCGYALTQKGREAIGAD